MSVYLRTACSPRCWSLASRRSYTVSAAGNAIHHPLQKSDKKHNTSTNSQAPAKAAQAATTPKVSSLKAASASAQANTSPKASGSSAPNVKAALAPTLIKKKSREETMAERSELSAQERLDELENLRMLEYQGVDIWSYPVQLFDLHVPTKLSTKKDATLRDHATALKATVKNWVKNVYAMRYMAKARAFPDVRRTNWWSPQVFRTQSTPWLAPFRKIAFDTYKEIQEAVASGDERTLKKYAIDNYRAKVLRIVKSRDQSLRFVWEYHGSNDTEPCRVVSIRAIEGHLAVEPPRYGNRLLVQALVKFDTNQNLKVYNKIGKLVSDPEAKPKRVVEYLVFQKRMWTTAPWEVRDQLYEGLEWSAAPMGQ